MAPVYDLGKAVVDIIDDSDDDSNEAYVNDISNEYSNDNDGDDADDDADVDDDYEISKTHSRRTPTKKKAAKSISEDQSSTPKKTIKSNSSSTKKSKQRQRQQQRSNSNSKRRHIFDLSNSIFDLSGATNKNSNSITKSTTSPQPKKQRRHTRRSRDNADLKKSLTHNNNGNISSDNEATTPKYDLGAYIPQRNKNNNNPTPSSSFHDNSPNRHSRVSNMEDSFIESQVSESPSEEEAHIHLLQLQYARKLYNSQLNSSLSHQNTSSNSAGAAGAIAGVQKTRYSRNNDNEPVTIDNVEFTMDQSIAVSEIRPLSEDGDYKERMKLQKEEEEEEEDDDEPYNNDADEDNSHNDQEWYIDINSAGVEFSPLPSTINNQGTTLIPTPNPVTSTYDNNIHNPNQRQLQQYLSDEENLPFLSESSRTTNNSTTNNLRPNRSIGTFNTNNSCIDALNLHQQEQDYQQALFSTSENRSNTFDLHNDIFTIMFVCPILSWGFLYSLFVYIVQLTILLLAITNIINKCQHPDNPLSIPFHTETEVVVAQLLALLVSVFTAKEIIHALDVFQIEYDEGKVMNVFPHATWMKWIMSHILRSLVGVLGILVAFFFIVQSTNVLDLFLDFAVVRFVGELDSLGFYFAEKGFFITDLKLLVAKIKTIHFKEKDTILICGTQRRIKTSVTQSFMFSLALCILLSTWSYFQIEQTRGHYYEYSCQRLEIHFDDYTLDFFRDYCQMDKNSDGTGSEGCPSSWMERHEPIRYSSFSDMYVAKLDSDGTVALHNSRPVYFQRGKEGFDAFGPDSPPGKFYYCQREKAWVFTIDGVHKGKIDHSDESCNWLMKSPETEAYTLDDIGSDGWTVWTGIIDVVEDFTMSCIECEYDKKNLHEKVVGCTYHGYCGAEESCVCDTNWMGSQCETCSSCSEFETTVMNGSSSSTSTGSEVIRYRRLDMLDENNKEHPVDVYSRPVYYKIDNEGVVDPELEVLLYDGRRYVIWDLIENSEVDDMTEIMGFLQNLHSTWDFVNGTEVMYASEPTKKPMPFNLKWANDLDETDEDKFISIEFKCKNEEELKECPFFYNNFRSQ